MRKLWIAVGVAALAGVLIWANLRQTRQAAGQTLGVRTVRLAAKTLTDTVLAPASLEVAREVEVRARSGGPVLVILVRPGDTVTAGQVLARVDRTDLEAAERQAASSLTQARATEVRLRRDATLAPAQTEARIQAAELGLQQAEAGLETTRTSLANQQSSARTRVAQARANLDAVRTRAAAGQATPEELAAALQQLQAAQSDLAAQDPETSPQVKEAELRVASARQSLAQVRLEAQAGAVLPEQIEAAESARLAAESTLADARSQLDQAEIKAPIAGTVLQVPVKDGQPAQPGLLVAVLGQTDRLVAKVRVDEVEIGKITPGLAVRINSPAFGAEKFSAKVARVDPLGTRAQQGTTTIYEVEVDVENPGGKLRAGMNVDAEIAASVHTDVLTLPVEALVEEDEKSAVWLIDNGVARRREVTPGLRTADEVEITAGLEAGTEVIIGPSGTFKNLKEGQRVKPEPAEGTPAEGTKAQ